MQGVSSTHKNIQKKQTSTRKSSKDLQKITSALSRVTKELAKTKHTTVSQQKLPVRTAQKVSSPYSKKLKRYAKQGLRSMLLSPMFHSTIKIVSITLVSSGLLYASYFFIGKTFANEVVVSQSEIIARVGKLTLLPPEDPYEVVRVQDESDLRKQNSFYKDVSEGDYVLMYKNLAVIYDLRNNSIKGVKRPGER